MKKLDIPGASLALVDGGRVVYRRRVRRARIGEAGARGCEHALHGGVEHEGHDDAPAGAAGGREKLRWDQPVTEAYPQFKLGDADETRQVLVKHLICACTGLPRQDLEWIFEFKNATPESLVGIARRHAADQQVRRSVPIQQSDGGRRRLHRRAPVRSEGDLGAAYDKAMQKLIFDSARDEIHDVRYGARAEGGISLASWRTMSTARPRSPAWRSTTRSCRTVRPAACGLRPTT